MKIFNWGSVDHQKEVLKKAGYNLDKFDADDPKEVKKAKQAAFQAMTAGDISEDDMSLLATMFGWH